jgi:hypothetical protein
MAIVRCTISVERTTMAITCYTISIERSMIGIARFFIPEPCQVVAVLPTNLATASSSNSAICATVNW